MKALTVTALLMLTVACGQETEISPALLAAEPTYERDIKPLYERHCVECHARAGAKSGGVELDRYESAFGTAVKSICTAIRPELVMRYQEILKPADRNPTEARGTCADWELFSMPTGVKDKLTTHEQIVLLRWLQTGRPR